MFDHATLSTAPAPAQLLLWRATAGLVLGAIIYLAVRDQLPVITPLWLANHPLLVSLRASVPDALTGPLPSFLHAYAVLMLTAAVAGQSPLAAPAMIGSTVLCLALEIIQHPVMTAAIAGSLDTVEATGLPKALLDYAASGTFDSLDLLAIALACAIVSIHTGLNFRRPPVSVRSF